MNIFEIFSNLFFLRTQAIGFECIICLFNSCFRVLYILWISYTVRCVAGKDSLPLCRLCRQPGDFFFSSAGAFCCMRSHLAVVGHNSRANGVLVRKSFSTPVSDRALAMFSLIISLFHLSHLGLWSVLAFVFVKGDRLGLISFFCMWTCSSQQHFLKMLLFLQFKFLAPLSNSRHLKLYELMFGSSVVFPLVLMSVFVPVPYCFITMALQYIFRSRMVIPPVLLFLFRIVLAIWDYLWFHMNFRTISFILVMNELRIFIEIAALNL